MATTYEQVLALLNELAQGQAELLRAQQETDRKFQDTDRKLQETARLVSDFLPGATRHLPRQIQPASARKIPESFPASPTPAAESLRRH